MNQMVVAVFDESAAFEGLRELRELHKEGGRRSAVSGQP